MIDLAELYAHPRNGFPAWVWRVLVTVWLLSVAVWLWGIYGVLRDVARRWWPRRTLTRRRRPKLTLVR